MLYVYYVDISSGRPVFRVWVGIHGLREMKAAGVLSSCIEDRKNRPESSATYKYALSRIKFTSLVIISLEYMY